MTTSSSAVSAAEELVRERDRVVERLRSMALVSVPVERVRQAAQDLADLAADVDGPNGDSPRRTVPTLAPYAAGDQIAVLALEVQAAAEPLDQSAAGELLISATTVLARLRHDL